MPLQKPMHFFGQFSADTFGGRDLIHARPAKAIHRAEPPQQQVFPVLAHAEAIVENAFFDSLFHEQLMICIGEPVCLIADALE